MNLQIKFTHDFTCGWFRVNVEKTGVIIRRYHRNSPEGERVFEIRDNEENYTEFLINNYENAKSRGGLTWSESRYKPLYFPNDEIYKYALERALMSSRIDNKPTLHYYGVLPFFDYSVKTVEEAKRTCFKGVIIFGEYDKNNNLCPFYPEYSKNCSECPSMKEKNDCLCNLKILYVFFAEPSETREGSTAYIQARQTEHLK